MLLRNFSFFNLGGDDLAANGHLHAVNRGPRGRWKNIARADGTHTVIGIRLLNRNIGYHPADINLDVGLLQRKPIHRRVPVIDKKIGRQGAVTPRLRVQTGWRDRQTDVEPQPQPPSRYFEHSDLLGQFSRRLVMQFEKRMKEAGRISEK